MANAAYKRKAVVLRVLGFDVPEDPEGADRVYRSRMKEMAVGGREIFAGYEDDGKTLRGFAFTVGGPGFWGPIEAVAAVGPRARKLLGLVFYRHQETPGLGARITESWFTKQFEGLPLTSEVDSAPLFVLTQPGAGSGKPNELDAITGATQTSRAVEAFLNRELRSVAVLLRHNIIDKGSAGSPLSPGSAWNRGG